MLRYVLVVVLVNLYGRGHGIPAHGNHDNGKMDLAKDLSGLANQCSVPFIEKEIETHLTYCNYTVSGNEPENPSALPCLMYYDINSRLCNALKLSGKSQITDENKAKLTDNLMLDDVCNLAKEWSVGELIKYPPYKLDIEKIFKSNSSSHCLRFCGVDALSDGVNYFCNYEKWAQEFIASLSTENKANAVDNVSTTTTTTSKQHLKLEQDNVVKMTEATNNYSVPKQTGADNPNLPPGAVDILPSQEHSSQDIEAKIHKPGLYYPNRIQITEKSKPPTTKPEKVVKTDPDRKTTENEDNIEDNGELDKPILLDSVSNNIQDEKATAKQIDEPPKDISNDFGGTGLDGDGDNYNGNTDDYEGSPQDTSVKKTLSKTLPTPSNKIEDNLFQGTNLGYVRDSTIAEAEGDNDHFFTVFLTGVLLVVVIYVLYHNKSKVTKVVLGLIVEGRHNTRRRNSRGHSYRRLDTLEQAMSTDTTAPPTKIIY